MDLGYRSAVSVDEQGCCPKSVRVIENTGYRGLCYRYISVFTGQKYPKTSQCGSEALSAGNGLPLRNSVAVLAEIFLESPRKIVIFIIKNNVNRIKASKLEIRFIAQK